MQVLGNFGHGDSTRLQSARLQVEGEHTRVLALDGTALTGAVPLNELQIPSRVGSTPRTLRFPDGACFTTEDNDALDRLLTPARGSSGLVHALESRWRMVALALLVTVATVAALIHWGIPAAARHVAFTLPATVMEQSEETALRVLDGGLLHPSRLEANEHVRLQATFRPMLDAHDDTQPLRVIFRDAKHSIGANALALPAGTIVFTDQLVAFARDDEELLAILAHEIGHVVHRHALRNTIQASTLSLAAVLILGDVSSVAATAASVPILLTELGYSRDFEKEADAFAVQALHRAGIAPTRLAEILQRLAPGEHSDYLATHPPTPERSKAIREAASVLH
mgnify:CR=1 FL=1|tara:strand:+ start:1080 stop:2096 length:1017 start_codon:yes stop_codon:yes gene_type:complete